MTQTKKQDNLVVLFFGDIIGKIGRRALVKILPELRSKYQPDLVIVNVENLAHGKGVTRKTWKEIADAGVDVGTGGNHLYKKEEIKTMFEEGVPIVRPANYSDLLGGQGFLVFTTPKGKVAVINLTGILFFGGVTNPAAENPFATLDLVLQKKPQDVVCSLVDFHAEITSEKPALGIYADGRVSAVLGTHSHIPTADNKILPQGTAYITDVGMVGARDSVGGGEFAPLLDNFLGTTERGTFEIPESGVCSINAVRLEIDPATGRAVVCERLDSEIEV